MNLAFDSLRLLQQAISKFQVMLHPPLRRPLHMPRIDIKTAAQSLVDGSVPLLHLLHQQFLLGRPHGHEHHIRPLFRHVVNQLSPFFLRLQVTVPVSDDGDTWILLFQLVHGLRYHLWLAPYQVERLFLMESRHDFQPQLAAGHFARLLMPLLFQGQLCPCPVAIPDIPVDDAPRLFRGMQYFFGIDGYQDALVCIHKRQQLVFGGKRIDFHSV